MTQQHSTPRLLTWVKYLATLFLLALPIAVLAVRSGAWQPGLALYALASLGSVVLLVLSVILLLIPRYAAWRKSICLGALAALPGALLLFSLASSGGQFPRIHDITTDTADPPQFVMAATQRGAGANTLDIKPESIAQQLTAYPDVQTLRSAQSAEDAFARALNIALTMNWEVYNQDANAGIIEAVATTGVMAFKDDIVIRVRDNNGGSRVDLRSVSRVGEGDIGANAKRIQVFSKAFLQTAK